MRKFLNITFSYELIKDKGADTFMLDSLLNQGRLIQNTFHFDSLLHLKSF